MAIIKAIELDSGIIVRYHRIVSVTNIVNHSVSIEIASYVNKSKREQEKQAIEKREPMNVFINTQRFNKEYDPNFTVEDAYNHIKSLEEFKGGEDDPSE